MSATDALRTNLSDAGIEYGYLGDYTTYVTSRGISWALTDNYDGTVAASVNRTTPDEAMRVITGHDAAHVVSVYDDDGVGHSECGECGRTVAERMWFCPWCGARFTMIERSYRP